MAMSKIFKLKTTFIAMAITMGLQHLPRIDGRVMREVELPFPRAHPPVAAISPSVPPISGVIEDGFFSDFAPGPSGGKPPVSAATATAGSISPSVEPTASVIDDELVDNNAPGGNPPTPTQAPAPTATVTATIPSVEPATSVIEDEIVNDIAPGGSYTPAVPAASGGYNTPPLGGCNPCGAGYPYIPPDLDNGDANDNDNQSDVGMVIVRWFLGVVGAIIVTCVAHYLWRRDQSQPPDGPPADLNA